MKLCRSKKHYYTPISGSKQGCPSCNKERAKNKYYSNRENILLKQKEDIIKNPEKRKKIQIQNYYKNREDRLIKKRNYYKQNKDKYNKWRKTINKIECALFKICTKCKIEKYHSCFHKQKEGTEFYSKCKSCKNKQVQSEKTKEKARLTRIQNKKYYQEYQKIYLKNNKGKRNFWTSKRRANRKKATPQWLTEEQLKEIEQWYIDAKDLQWLSDPTDPLHVDHIEPLQGKNSCGLHVPWNLQILPRSLNSKKSNKTK